MKSTKTITTLLIIGIFISIATAYIAGFFIYRDYKEKTAYLERLARNKFEELENNLKDLYITLENMIDEDKIEKQDLLSKLENIKEDIENWKEGYRVAISELRASLEDLKVEALTRMVEKMQDEINEFKTKIQDLDLKIDEVKGSVDLGRISVGK